MSPDNILKIFNSFQGFFCYQLFYFLTDKENVKVFTNPDQPNTFILKYQDMITTYGHKGTVEQLLNTIIKENELEEGTRYRLLFQNHHLKSIQLVFDDFDFIEDSVSYNDGINRLQIMMLDKNRFIPKRQLKSGKRIKAELLESFDPTLAEYAKTGVVYGIIEDTNLISAAPVPFIYKDPEYSFAILHNVFTKEEKRNKGYATGSIRAALNFLFTRKVIKQVYMAIDEQNIGFSMLEKIGFESTGGEWLATFCFLKE